MAIKDLHSLCFLRGVSKPIFDDLCVINLLLGWRCGSVSSCPLFSCSWFGMLAVAALTQTPLEFLVLHLFYVCTGWRKKDRWSAVVLNLWIKSFLGQDLAPSSVTHHYQVGRRGRCKPRCGLGAEAAQPGAPPIALPSVAHTAVCWRKQHVPPSDAPCLSVFAQKSPLVLCNCWKWFKILLKDK